jgi:hypothetical protein
MGIVATAAAGLFLVTRFPQPGRTKTRLIPVLGAEGAANLQRQMTEHLLHRLQPYCRHHGLRLEIHFAGGTTAQMLAWLGTQIRLSPQCEGTLGQRLNHAFERGFATGLRRIFMIASDCPGISEREISEAAKQLDTHDVVLGPAEDGGYYLIGLKAPQPQLFETISWGQSCVLQQTIAQATQAQLTVSLLNPLPDIDRPEDLPLWAPYAKANIVSSA